MKKIPRIRLSLMKYWAFVMLAAAPFCLQSCGKDNSDPKHDVELTFTDENIDNIHLDTIKKYAADNSVRYIYMVPENNGWSFARSGASVMENFRTILQKRIDVAPDKVKGYGSIQFTRGGPTLALADSLWFVQNGWKVNDLQYTK